MWRWVKACKGAALISFVLPWMTVSCSGQKLASATGLNLLTGDLTITNPVTGAQEAHDGDVNVMLLIGLVAIVVGLVAAFRSQRLGARVVFATSVVALATIWLATRGMSNEALMREVERRQGGVTHLDATALAMVRVDWGAGYWLAVLSLLAAIALSWMALTDRRISFERTRAFPSEPVPPS